MRSQAKPVVCHLDQHPLCADCGLKPAIGKWEVCRECGERNFQRAERMKVDPKQLVREYR